LTIRQRAVVLAGILAAVALLGNVYGQGYIPAATGGGGSPNDAEYVVGAADGTLSAERVVTDTETLDWDLGTAAQAKVHPLGFVRPTIVLSTGCWPGYGQGGFWVCSCAATSTSWIGYTPEDATSTRPTVIKGSTGSSNGDQAYHVSTDTVVNISHSALFQSWVEASSTDTLYFLGFIDPTAAPFTSDPAINIAAFRLDTSVGANYYCYTNDGAGGGTANDSGVTSDANGHTFQIQETNSTDWKFWIDGTLVCTNTTNRPAAALGYGLTAKNLAASAKTYRMAYFYTEETITW